MTLKDDEARMDFLDRVGEVTIRDRGNYIEVFTVVSQWAKGSTVREAVDRARAFGPDGRCWVCENYYHHSELHHTHPHGA